MSKQILQMDNHINATYSSEYCNIELLHQEITDLQDANQYLQIELNRFIINNYILMYIFINIYII